MNAKEEVAQKFAIGASDGLVHVTSIGKFGETSTRTITREAARELAIQLIEAAQ